MAIEHKTDEKRDGFVVVRTCPSCGARHSVAAEKQPAAEFITQLEARCDELERQLGILREPDGTEVRVGVTAERVAELRVLAAGKSNEFITSVVLSGLRDALRFYDLVRKAWEGTREDYDEVALERDELKNELRKYEPSDGMMHKLLGLYGAIDDAAKLYERIRSSETEYHAPWDEFDAWLKLPAVVQARKAMKR